MAMALVKHLPRQIQQQSQAPHKVCGHQVEVCCSRRLLNLGFLAAAFPAAAVDPAQAFSLGISGPKDWLKEQKKKTADFLLIPIHRSRERLENAFLLLSSNPTQNHSEAGTLVKVAARDCIPLEAGSFPEFQTRSGVEVCTFRLLVKNAASLLDDSDPVKVKAYLALDELIRSLKVLDDSIAASNSSSIATLRKSSTVSEAFFVTYSALDEFEAGIRACLGIA